MKCVMKLIDYFLESLMTPPIDVLTEQVLVAIALEPRRNWDNWIDGMVLVMCSIMEPTYNPVDTKELLQELLFEQFATGCCSGGLS